MATAPIFGTCQSCGACKRLHTGGWRQGSKALCKACYSRRRCHACDVPLNPALGKAYCQFCEFVLAMSTVLNGQTPGQHQRPADLERRLVRHQLRAERELPLFA